MDNYDGYSDYLRHTGHVTCYLVVTGPRRNSVRVPVDSIEEADAAP